MRKRNENLYFRDAGKFVLKSVTRSNPALEIPDVYFMQEQMGTDFLFKFTMYAGFGFFFSQVHRIVMLKEMNNKS